MKWDTIKESLLQGGFHVGKALLILVVGWFLVVWGTNLLEGRMKKRKTDQTFLRFMMTFLRFILKGIVIMAAISALGNFSATLAAIVGAGALSLGLSLQGALSNLAGGILLVIFRPFNLGDVIESGGLSGQVQDIGILTTTLRSLDNKLLYLPNGKVASESIINHTACSERRLDLSFRVKEGSDVLRVRDCLLGMARAEAMVLKDPPPQLHLVSQRDGLLDFSLKSWVKTEDYWNLYWEFLEEGHRRLHEAGMGTSSTLLRTKSE